MAEFHFRSRLADHPEIYGNKPAYPGTRRYQSEILRNGKYIGGFSNCKLPDIWMAFLRLIETAAQWAAMWVEDFGWHNSGEIGVVEYVVFINDTLWVEEIVNNRAYIRSLCLEDAPPDTSTNFWDGFTMVFFSVLGRDGSIFPHDAGWIRTLVLRREKSERLWMDVRYLTAI